MLRRFSARLLVLLGACGVLLVGIPAKAADTYPWEAPAFTWDVKAGLAALEKLPPRPPPPKDEEKEKEKEEAKEGAEDDDEATTQDVDLLLEDRRVVFDAQARQTETTRWVFWVRTAKGARAWARISTQWRAFLEDVPVIRARVISPDGQVHQLDPKTLSTGADDDDYGDEYNDGSVLHGPLPAMGAGVLVEEEVASHEHAPLFDAGIVSSHWFRQGNGAPRHVRMRVEVPSSLPFRYQTFGGAPPVRESHTDTLRVLDIETGPLPVQKFEAWLPKDVETYPFIKYSVGGDWHAIAVAYDKIVETQLAGGPPAEVRRWRGKAEGRENIARTLLAGLHKSLRYTALELGAAALTPTPPGEALQRKYGDCKDMATMMVGALRDAGIPARVALLNAGRGSDVTPSLPGMGDFNHAIVYVPGTPEMWIDPTDENVPLGELPLADQDRLALVISPDTKTLQRTPTMDARANRTTVTQEIFFADDGASRIVETRESWGGPAAFRREQNRNTNAKDLRARWEKSLLSEYAAHTLSRFEVSSSDDVDKPYRMVFELPDARRGYTNEESATAWVYPRQAIEDLPDLLLGTEEEHGADERKHDFVFDLPIDLTVRFRLVPPPGYEARPIPEDTLPSLAPFKLTHEFQKEPGGAVSLTYHFETPVRRLTPAQYASVRAAAKEFSANGLQVVFDSTTARLVKDGKVKEAADLYRSFIAANPTKTVYQARLARLWQSAGAFRAARDSARRAVQTDSKSAMAQATLGDILLHDAFGRRLSSQADRTEAIAAWREAVKLEPKNGTYRIGLFSALEVGDDGNPYSAGSHLEELAAAYASYRDDQKSTDYDQPYLSTLLRLGRAKEILALKPPASRKCDACEAMVLAARALQNGVPALLAETRKLKPELSKQAELMKQVGVVLAVIREYPTSTEVLSATQDLSATPDPSLKAFIKLVGRAKKVDQTPFSNKTPEDVALAAVRGFFNPDAAVAQLRNTYATETIEAWGGTEVVQKEAKSVGRSMQAAFGPLGTILNVADMVVPQLQPATEGDDNIGYRILFKTADVPSPPFALFVTKQGDSYRVVATDTALERVGDHVLALVDAHKDDAARQWLDWTLDAHRPGLDRMFASAWSRSGPRTPEEIRRAAALLMLDGTLRLKAVKTLEALPPPADHELAQDLNISSAFADIAEKRYDAALARVTEAMKTAQTNPFLISLRDSALRGLRRAPEANALAEARLKDDPNDHAAMRALVRAALDALNWERAQQLELGIAEHSSDKFEMATAYNNLAWYAFASGKATPAAIAQAEKSDELSHSGRSATLHTLACLYAISNRPTEALATLGKSVQSGSGEIEPYQWFTLGLLYESYGLPDDARDAYVKGTADARVSRSDAPESSAALAKLRLARLPAAKVAPSK